MLVFGVDVPLIEIVLALAAVMVVLLIEALVVIIVLMKQMNKTRKISEAVQELSDTLLQIKKSELEQLDRILKK